MNRKAGFVSLLLSAVVFSSLGIAVRFFSSYFGNITQVAVRVIATFSILLIVMLLRSESLMLPVNKLNRLAFATYCLTKVASSILFVLSVMLINVASTVFYLYLASFVTAFVLGALVFKEGMSRQKSIGLLFALGGVFVYSFPIESTFSWGVVFGVMAGVSDTLQFTSQKFMLKISRNVLILWTMGFGSILMLLVGMLSGEQLLQPIDLKLVVAIPLFGIVILALNQLLLFGFNNFWLSSGTIIVSAELIFALIVSAIVLGEVPKVTEVAGGLLLFTSIVIANDGVSMVKQVVLRRGSVLS